MQAVMAVRSWLVGHTSNENTYFPGVSQTYKGLTKSGVALYKRVKFKPPFSAKNRGSHYTRDRICTRINTVHVCNINNLYLSVDLYLLKGSKHCPAVTIDWR